MSEITITKEASETSKNMSLVFILRVAQYPFLALYIMIVPRMMGPQTYGNYALLLSIVAIVAPLIGLALAEIYGRFVPEFRADGHASRISKFSSNVLALKGVIDLVTVVILFPILRLFYGDQFKNSYFYVIIAIILLIDLAGVPYTLVFGLNKLGKYALRDPIRRVLNLVFIIVLFHYYGLFGALLSTLLTETVLGAIYVYWTKEYFHLRDLRIDFAFLKPYLSFGFIFYLSWGLLNIWQRLGNALIAHFSKDPAQVALFDLPNQIYSISTSFIIGLVVSLVPMFTALLLSRKEQKLINWSALVIKYLAIFCTLIIGFFIVLGPDLIPVIIGPEYQKIFPNAVVLLSGMFPMIIAQFGYVYSIVYKEPRKYLSALCLAFATFLIASVLLIPNYASLGCSIASLISAAVMATAMMIYYRKQLSSGLLTGLMVIGLGSVFIPFTFLRNNLITNLILVICATLAYGMLLFISRALKIGELAEVLQAIREKPLE